MKIFAVLSKMQFARSAGLAIAGLAVASAVFVGSAEARKVSDAVKVACSGDYSRLCNGYEVGSQKLDSCMRTNGKRLSRVCADALHREGHMTRGEYSKWRKSNNQ
ncbi:conserved exported protein of unknown function [Candidatus Filomicrobium marinum]|uniref:3',5'-cyclic-nucleotide phosphodiesterase n=2 Tax=Filomicrobium TaxID=119044 RepID=A0A0D6JA64_9HYPH|nr:MULTISPECIES: hypothetical protein [Filomicrobium]MCV0368861.1 hypothetical protein [Filomicrobium sp.]CFW97641.1 conserved exported protein of unknown function [Candidatus Filomicrobium marinum]CPR14727.1 conserved exported protein of unknown function [Candidatus Filomicrobium marinum]SDO76490.1 hypothetical protein SAMN04488061_1595 [Filomicrobium insigne]